MPTTIWLYHDQLTRAGAPARLFARFDAMLAECGFLAMGGQIVDATAVEAGRQRLTRAEKADAVRCWQAAALVQRSATGDRPRRPLDRQARPQGRAARGRRPAPYRDRDRGAVFGDKNHLDIDRGHGFVHRFTVTHAARRDGSQLGAVLDPNNTGGRVWADTAYRRTPNVELIDRRGLVPGFEGAKRCGKPRSR